MIHDPVSAKIRRILFLPRLFVCLKNKPPVMQEENRSLDKSMNSRARIKVGLQNHK